MFLAVLSWWGSCVFGVRLRVVFRCFFAGFGSSPRRFSGLQRPSDRPRGRLKLCVLSLSGYLGYQKHMLFAISMSFCRYIRQLGVIWGSSVTWPSHVSHHAVALFLVVKDMVFGIPELARATLTVFSCSFAELAGGTPRGSS